MYNVQELLGEVLHTNNITRSTRMSYQLFHSVNTTSALQGKESLILWFGNSLCATTKRIAKELRARPFLNAVIVFISSDDSLQTFQKFFLFP